MKTWYCETCDVKASGHQIGCHTQHGHKTRVLDEKRAPARRAAPTLNIGNGATYDALNVKREALLAQANRIQDAMNTIKEL